MTTSGYAAADAQPIVAGPSVRERIGLKVEHLLPGLDIADRMLRAGDAQGALRTCAALVLCDPLEPRFQIGLATCALGLGLHGVAVRAASAVIALEPARPEGYRLHAHASVGLAQYDSAIDDFTEALRLARELHLAEITRDCERMLARLAPAKAGAVLSGQDSGAPGEPADGSTRDASKPGGSEAAATKAARRRTAETEPAATKMVAGPA